MTGLVIFEWDGEVMRPQARFAKLCDKVYVVGEKYRMEVVEERSVASHNHYFAALKTAWDNLPEAMALDFPTVEALRKWALIKTGYCSVKEMVLPDEASAHTVAAFIRGSDEIVIVEGNVVRRITAASQSTHAMDRKTFQKSKEDVLNYVSGLIGVSSKKLEKEGAKSDVAPFGREQ